ncbi:hypothetical protein PIB30_068812 [Stylosanthes scabra]|uniref:Uncharacterized protein n=1 Tax=Stylosanthes scabra TaxID=79078 RepID=A0ABU6ZLP0_9FABA|nr:hypothetical protein [Stylosanthes scabra]
MRRKRALIPLAYSRLGLPMKKIAANGEEFIVISDNITHITELHLPCDTIQSDEILDKDNEKWHCLSELHLEECQLQNINPSLQYANFTSLKFLNLAFNEFSSVLPAWLFNLSDISYIDISKNFMHGQLPQTLPKFHQSIESLYLNNNDLDGPIPDWLSQLDQLQVLALSHNSFNGPISTILGNLSSSLIELRLHSNNLTGIVSEKDFHLLSKLKILGLGSTSLIFDLDTKWNPPFQLQVLALEYLGPKFPPWIYTQSSLKVLYIGNSRASFQPLGKFWKFTAQLEVLNLINNSINADMSNVLLDSKVVIMLLSGSVPQVTQNMTHLDLSYNNLSDISPFLCQKVKGKWNLETLFISDNALSGEIPNCFMNWRSLLQVNLGNNNLRGKIPHSIGSLSRLIFLGLEKNKFMSLNLSHNQLMGMVPQDLGNLTKLESLDLSSDLFSPLSMSSMSFLESLNLSCNNFEGEIPSGTQLEGFTNLSYFVDLHSQRSAHKMRKPKREDGDDDADNSEVWSWFFMGLGIGFATSFWEHLVLFSSTEDSDMLISDF